MVTGGLRFLENLHKHLFILWNLCDSHSSFHSRHRRCFCSCVLASLAHIDVCCSCTQSLHLCLFFTPAEKSIPLFLLRPWLTPVESTVSLTVHYIRKSNVSDLKGSWPTLPTKKRKNIPRLTPQLSITLFGSSRSLTLEHSFCLTVHSSVSCKCAAWCWKINERNTTKKQWPFHIQFDWAKA